MKTFIEKISLANGDTYVANYVRHEGEKEKWSVAVYQNGAGKPLMTCTRPSLSGVRNEVWKHHARSPKATVPAEKASK